MYKSRTVDKRWELAKRYGLVRSHCGARQDHGGGRRKANTHETFQEDETKRIALRTIPIVLKNGDKRILVNCFLDEGSDTTYVNEDVVEELGLRGKKEKITVNVANGQQVSFNSMTFEIGLESTDGNIDTKIVAKTSERICGGMKPVNWIKIQNQWNHLRKIPFPKLVSRGIVDVLLGTDHYHLMFSKEVLGKESEPCARLCVPWDGQPLERSVRTMENETETHDSITRFAHVPTTKHLFLKTNLTMSTRW